MRRALIVALLMELTGQALSGAMLVNLHCDALPAPVCRLRAAFAGAMPRTGRGLLGGGHCSRSSAFLRARARVGAGARRHQPWCTSPSMQLAEEPQDSSEEDRARLDEERAKLDRLFKMGAAPDAAPESPSGPAASLLADGGPSAGTPLLRGPRDSAAADEPKAKLRPDEAGEPSIPGDLAASGASARAADGDQGGDQSPSPAARSPGAARPPRHRCKWPNIDCKCG